MSKNCKYTVSRRWFLLASSSLPLLPGCSHNAYSDVNSTETVQHGIQQLIEIERGTGGRIGVAAKNLHTGATLNYREDERFAMCSTFKWVLSAAILRNVEQGTEFLERTLTWTANDLVSWSPVTKPLIEKSTTGAAQLSVGELCSAMMRTSDNTAANVLLDIVDGPSGLTRSIRLMGDPVTRLDRIELELNRNTPGDPRDTSTPRAMVTLMRDALYGDVLQSHSQVILKNWLMSNETGKTRLRAGLPEGWLVGDRTGTSTFNANNNLAFAESPVESPSNGPLLIVSFTNAPNPTKKEANAVHADIARVISSTLL